jgi:hypothetical protein
MLASGMKHAVHLTVIVANGPASGPGSWSAGSMFQSPPSAPLSMSGQARVRPVTIPNPCLTFLHGKVVNFGRPGLSRPARPGRRPSTTVERLVYITLIIIFDTLDAVAAVLRWDPPFDKKLENRVR